MYHLTEDRISILRVLITVFVTHLFFLPARSQPTDSLSAIDVIRYTARVEPDFPSKSISGKVTIHFAFVTNDVSEFKLDCGNLVIDSVRSGIHSVPFKRSGGTILFLRKDFDQKRQQQTLEILYHGKPGWAMQFFPEKEEAYTVFSTGRWLVCKDSPLDKASVELQIKVPEGLEVVSVGVPAGKQTVDRKVIHTWIEQRSVPTYTFGLVTGHFNQAIDKYRNTELRYSGHYSESELKRIFAETGAMMEFFENRSGIRYPRSVYSQVESMGSASQEMSGFCVVRNGYGKQVLETPMDINLAAHELAHQWWGNEVTCSGWGHFWLNEGFAVFMSSAFKEHRFGREEYLKDIDVYFNAYRKVVSQGKDKALAFMDWSNPTPEDRSLVYYKGAYVLHVLREELGDELFWEGIRQYTSLYFGKSVKTKNFQDVMEKVCQRSLEPFFSKWVNAK